MSRGISKSQAALNEARARMQTAQYKVNDARAAVETAASVLNALTESYYALERALAPKPRSNGAAKSVQTLKRPTCSDCGLWSTDKLHTDKSATLNLNGNTIGYHPFVPSPRAPRASKPKKKEAEMPIAPLELSDTQ